MEPRIYTYKVTFEEIPDWYWGSHKEKKYEEPYMGSPDTHAWKWEVYTPTLEICELFPYTDEGWVEAQKIEKKCIRPDLNNPLCLNENLGGVMSLEASRRGAKKSHETTHAEKDDLGRSLNAVKAATAAHEEKDYLGRSVQAVRALGKAHDEKTDLGKSVTAVKGGKAVHEEKDELGRSVQGVKNAEKMHSQKWKDPLHPELGEHGPGNLVRMQKRRGYPHGKENRVRVSPYF
jgi:hypothetical protein